MHLDAGGDTVSEMQVGRDLDAAVAKALGYPLDGAIVQVTDKRPSGSGIWWSPSTSIADAFAALDAVLAKDDLMDIKIGMANHEWYVELQPVGAIYDATGATLAEAICRVILALEVTP